MRSIYPSHISGTITDTRMRNASIFGVTSRMARFTCVEDASMQQLIHDMITRVAEQCVRDAFGYHAVTVSMLALDCMDGHTPWAQLVGFFERGIDMHTIVCDNVRETFKRAEEARQCPVYALTFTLSSLDALELTYTLEYFSQRISLKHEYEAQYLASLTLAFLKGKIDAAHLQRWLHMLTRGRPAPVYCKSACGPRMRYPHLSTKDLV